VSAPLILCYHAVGVVAGGSSTVSESTLSTQLAFLRRGGYVGFTVSELERLRRQDALPPRAVAITFDDGYASVLRAQPLLASAQYPATAFVVTEFVDSGLPLRWPGIDHQRTDSAADMRPLRWDDLESLQALGWEVGSHTVTHPSLPGLDDASLARELADSRRAIAQRLGSCRALAYPYGEADSRVAAAAALAGYDAACTLSISHRVDEPLRRPRTGIYEHDHGLRLRIKLLGATRYLRRSVAGPELEALVRAAVRHRPRQPTPAEP
jgi:peptidoglycan/xylan/chitin deacetylase (PgdA/CDA1 family)